MMEPNIHDTYFDFTSTTAVYPEEVAAPYLALGIVSEIAETQERLIEHGILDEDEIGDVQWYVARLCHQYNLPFRCVVRDADTLQYRHAAREQSKGMELLLMSTEAGLIAGKIKKQLRDGENWTGEQRHDVRQYIRDRLVNIVAGSIAVLGGRAGYDKAIKKNTQKLADRSNRGVLKGDGSDR